MLEGEHVRRRPRLGPLARERAHRVAQPAEVEIEPPRARVARLLGPEQVARAAEFQVAQRDPVTRPQVRVLLQHAQPVLRLAVHLVGHQQVARRAAVPAAHAPAQLVQLRQAELVRPVDDDRVGVGHVEPRLHDQGRDQHVHLTAHVPPHDLVQGALQQELGHLIAVDSVAVTQDEGTLTVQVRYVALVTREPASYPLFRRDGQDVAGMMNPTARDYAGSPPPRWIGYIAVADADAIAAQVPDLGGTVLEEPHDIPGVGRISMFTDPTGALVYVMQPQASTK